MNRFTMLDSGLVVPSDALPEDRFRAVLREHRRVAVAGVPRAGKTTLSRLVADRPVVHTDDYLAAGWDDCPKECAIKVPAGPVVVEGVRAIAVTRELLLRGKEPITCVVWLDQPHPEADDSRTRTAAKGRRKAFENWLRSGDIKGMVVVRL